MQGWEYDGFNKTLDDAGVRNFTQHKIDSATKFA